MDERHFFDGSGMGHSVIKEIHFHIRSYRWLFRNSCVDYSCSMLLLHCNSNCEIAFGYHQVKRIWYDQLV